MGRSVNNIGALLPAPSCVGTEKYERALLVMPSRRKEGKRHSERMRTGLALLMKMSVEWKQVKSVRLEDHLDADVAR